MQSALADTVASPTRRNLQNGEAEMARLEHEEGLTGCAFLKRPRSCHTFVATSTESESVSLWAARRDPAQARVGHLEQAHTDRVSRYVFVYFFYIISVYIQSMFSVKVSRSH